MTTRLATGRSALTEYRTLETFERFSYLEVRIGTGRTHQIRVHLASLRHPVEGDPSMVRPLRVSRAASSCTRIAWLSIQPPLAAALRSRARSPLNWLRCSKLYARTRLIWR